MRIIYYINVIDSDTNDESTLEFDVNREVDVCDILYNGKVIASADWSHNLIHIFEEIVDAERKLSS